MKGDVIVNQKFKFDLYDLGTAPYGQPPSFSSGTYKTTFEFEIPVIDEFPTISTYTDIGAINTSNYTVSLNQYGMVLNNLCPFTSDKTFYWTFSNNDTYAQRFYSILNSLSDAINLSTYITWPSSGHRCFALAGSKYYMLYWLQGSSSNERYLYSGGLYHGGWYDKATDNLISKNFLPFVSFSYVARSVYIRNIERKALRISNGKYFAVITSVDIESGSNYVRIKTQEISDADAELYNDFVYDPGNPYDDYSSSSDAEGGDGNFDNTTQTIAPPAVPTTSVTGTGFVRIYNPTLSQLQSLSRYMWTDTTFINSIVNLAKKMLENPMEAIISLNLLPCPIPNGASENVKVMFIDTGVQMPPATTQFVDVDCGYYDVKEYYGSALDYAPNTKIQCYLPYIGQVSLDTDEVMGKRVSIKYRIDIVTGMCVAMILVNGTVLYQHTGHCAIAMPLTSGDFSNYVSAALGVAKAIGGLAASAAGAPQLASGLLDLPMPVNNTSYTKTTNTVRNEKTGRQITKSGKITEHISPRGPSYGEIVKAGVANSVQSIMGAKATVERSGGFSGNSGYLAVRRPYLIFQIPRICLPENYGKFRGYPSMINLNLGICKGYTEVQEIQLKNIPATNPELSEIVTLLKGGVVF